MREAIERIVEVGSQPKYSFKDQIHLIFQEFLRQQQQQRYSDTMTEKKHWISIIETEQNIVINFQFRNLAANQFNVFI